MIFTKRFKNLRELTNLSQQEIASKLGVSQSAVAKWELEKTEPTATAIVNSALFFNVSADYLLGLENEDGTKIYAQDYNTPTHPTQSGIIVPPDIVGHVHSYHIPARSGEATDIIIDADTDAKVTAILRKLDEEDKDN